MTFSNGKLVTQLQLPELVDVISVAQMDSGLEITTKKEILKIHCNSFTAFYYEARYKYVKHRQSSPYKELLDDLEMKLAGQEAMMSIRLENQILSDGLKYKYIIWIGNISYHLTEYDESLISAVRALHDYNHKMHVLNSTQTFINSCHKLPLIKKHKNGTCNVYANNGHNLYLPEKATTELIDIIQRK